MGRLWRLTNNLFEVVEKLFANLYHDEESEIWSPTMADMPHILKEKVEVFLLEMRNNRAPGKQGVVWG